MSQNGETPDARHASGAEGFDGDRITHQPYSTNSGVRKQADSAAERLSENGGEGLLDAGLKAIARGWKIFPCNGKKEPLVQWSKAATTDEVTIRAWARQWSGALWARALPADIVVIDLDVKHSNNGIREFERLQDCSPDQFDAPRVRTGSGGIHLYTNAAGRDFKNTRSALAPGIDTKTFGGYCIIPSGDGFYRWETDPDIQRPPAPAWTEAALRINSNLESVAEAKAFQGVSPFGNALLVSARKAIANAPNGKQEETLNDRPFQIGRYIGGGLLDCKDTIEALVMAGLHMSDFDKRWEWTEKEIRTKVIHAVDKGMLKPLDGEESFRAMQEVHRQYFDNPKLHEAVEELLLEEEAKRKAEQPAQKKQEDKQQEPPPNERLLVRRMGKGVPSPVAFLVEELFHEVGTGIIASKYYGGKTYVAMALAASVASGIPFAGRTVNQKGAVLWLAAEGEWEVDKRIRAAVRALDCDPDELPIYVQIASVPKLLADKGEAAVMQLVRQAVQLAKNEFDLPVVLIVFDTMIKSAGYKKSENDSVEVNNMIRAMENISVRTKCFVLALDHMGKNEELGARGSSDKPSSVDVYIELKSNGGAIRTFHAVKVKGEKGDDQVEFEIVGAKLDDGQKTACVRWGKWREPGPGMKLNGVARLLLECTRDTITRKGEQRLFMYGEPERRAVQKKEIYSEFGRKHKGDRHDMAFKRGWDELVKNVLVTTSGDEHSAAALDKWVYLEKG